MLDHPDEVGKVVVFNSHARSRSEVVTVKGGDSVDIKAFGQEFGQVLNSIWGCHSVSLQAKIPYLFSLASKILPRLLDETYIPWEFNVENQ